MKYYVELESNESEALYDGGMTAGFSIPEALQAFEIHAENIGEAVRIAYGYLQGFTEVPFEKIDYDYMREQSAGISFPNFEDGLNIVYSINCFAIATYDYVCCLTKEYQELVAWRLQENGITDSEDVERAMTSRVSDLEDSIDISDFFSDKPINKCTFCGKVDFSSTKVIGGYTILDSCESCTDEI